MTHPQLLATRLQNSRLTLLICVCLVATGMLRLQAQTLVTIPTPAGYTSSGDGYKGSPIEYDGNLYLQYEGLSRVFDLFMFDGDTLTKIPSPPGFNTTSLTAYAGGYQGEPVVYNNNLYLQYLGSDGNKDLFKYDGNSLTQIPSPAGYDSLGNSQYGGYTGHPIVYNDSLYLQYLGNDGSYVLAKYNGNTLTIIPSPAGFENPGSGYRFSGLAGAYPIVYNGKLYLQYKGNDGNYDLFSYDGNTLTQVSLPAAVSSNDAGYQGFPIVYNGYLYLQYRYSTALGPGRVLYKFDGNTFTEIPSPPNFNGTYDSGYYGYPKLHNNELFLAYTHDNSYTVLFNYDGDTLTEIPSPPGYDTTSGLVRGYLSSAESYNNDLFVRYYSNSGLYDMLKYDGNTLTVLSLPANYQYIHPVSFVLNGAIYFQLSETLNGPDVMFKYDGNSFTEIPSPPNYTTHGYDSYSSFLYQGNRYVRYRNNGNSYDLMLLDTSSPCNATAASVAETVCGSYTSPSGNNTWTSSGTYTDTITNLAGCDSVITINLTVLSPSISTVAVTICNGYQYGGHNATGLYTDTFNNANGCDSIRTLDLTVIVPTAPTISQTDTILSIPDDYDSYQWYQNGTATGTDTSILVVTMDDDYWVTATDSNGCQATSDTFTVTGLIFLQAPAPPSNLSANPVAKQTLSAVTLNWQDNSNNELNFEIERSLDNANWSVVATVDSNISYYDDGNLAVYTTYYYRVAATNQGGKSAYSNVDSVTTVQVGIQNIDKINFNLYPNPTTGRVAVMLSLSKGGAGPMQATITVTNTLGQVVQQLKLNGTDQAELDLHDAGAGMYFVTVQTPKGHTVRKLVVE